MQPDEKPWWYYRCMHNTHEVDLCWDVYREAEGAVILKMRCLSRVHITIDLDGVGSVCQEFTRRQFEEMSQAEVMALIQHQRNELRSLRPSQ